MRDTNRNAVTLDSRPCARNRLDLRSIELTINLFSLKVIVRSGRVLRERLAERTSFVKFRGDWRVRNGRLPINPSWRFQRFPVTIAARGTSTPSEANVFERSSVLTTRWQGSEKDESLRAQRRFQQICTSNRTSRYEYNESMTPVERG